MASQYGYGTKQKTFKFGKDSALPEKRFPWSPAA